MKKINKVYLGLTLLLLSPIIVSANTISSKTICNKTKIMIGEKITCEVSITSEEYLDNITTNINYDKKYLSLESIQGLNTFKSYSNQTLLGTLAWGETKTFTLPKPIVQSLKNGTCNSLAVYVNSNASNCYLNIVSANITLKTKK